MSEHRFGTLNGHSAGIVLKELVRRAIIAIRAEREAFEVNAKHGYDGALNDVCTSADKKAQDIYLRSLRECFPGWGLLAEEDRVDEVAEGKLGYFTVDPLDGTKAFIRRQSHGVGTMIAMVQGPRVLSAYIGDVNTQEIYGYRPDSTNVHRITEFETAERLIHRPKRLPDQHILLRDPPEDYSQLSRDLLPVFKSYEVTGGSIGTWMARLWKGEVGAALLPPGWETPWDATPVRGISEKLGFRFFKPMDDGKAWEACDLPLSTATQHRPHDLLVIHADDVLPVRFITFTAKHRPTCQEYTPS